MTHPSPLPPPADPGTQLGISHVLAGQVLVDQTTGAETIAPTDLVILSANIGGKQRAAYTMTPPQAMAVARALSAECGKIIAAEIDDDGAPLSPQTRLVKFGAL
jgi:hypothetical protein